MSWPAGRPWPEAPALRSCEGVCAALVAVVLAWSTLTIWMTPRWPLSLAQATILLAAAVLGARLVHRPEAMQAAPPLALLAAAVVWAFLLCATGRTVYAFASWDALVRWTVAFALVALGIHLFGDERLRRRFLLAFVWFALAVAVVALVQFYAPNGKIFWLFPYRHHDVLGPFPNRNNFAAFIELAVPIALWRAWSGPGARLLYVAVAASLAAAVVASGSRAGAGLVAGEILFVLLLAQRQGKLRQGGGLGTAVWTFGLAAVAVLVAGWELLWRRLQAADLLVYRRQIWASTLEMIAARPLTGFGPGTFETVYPAFASFDVGLVVNHAHNDWLEWAAEAGIPFVLMLVGIAVWAVRPALRSLWGVGLLAVFLHALVDYPLERLGVAGWVWLLVGGLAAEDSSEKAQRLSP